MTTTDKNLPAPAEAKAPPAFSPCLLSQVALTKVSHDISNALSGVINSAELLIENLSDKAFSQKAAEITLNSATMLARRMKFFRGALGTFGPLAHEEELRQTVEEYLTTYSTPIALEFSLKDMLPERLSLVALCVLVGASAVIQEGRITLSGSGSAFEVRTEAKRLRLDPALQNLALLRQDAAGGSVSPRDVPLFLVLSYAESNGAALRFEASESAIVFYGE